MNGGEELNTCYADQCMYYVVYGVYSLLEIQAIILSLKINLNHRDGGQPTEHKYQELMLQFIR